MKRIDFFEKMRYNIGRHRKTGAALTLFERTIIMKRIIALLLCIGMFAAVAAGCGGTTKEETATGDEAKSLKASDYKDDFNGLCTYLSAYGYINPLEDNKGVTYTVMKAEIIGAKQGRRFTAKKSKDTTIEIYEYDLKKLDDTAKDVIESVKNDGTFINLVGETVDDVYMSNNGKYLMIYNDTTINADTKEDDDNYKTRADIVKKFKAFHEK